MQIERLQNRLRVARERLVLVPRALRHHVFHQLDFLELMLADQAARVLAI